MKIGTLADSEPKYIVLGKHWPRWSKRLLHGNGNLEQLDATKKTSKSRERSRPSVNMRCAPTRDSNAFAILLHLPPNVSTVSVEIYFFIVSDIYDILVNAVHLQLSTLHFLRAFYRNLTSIGPLSAVLLNKQATLYFSSSLSVINCHSATCKTRSCLTLLPTFCKFFIVFYNLHNFITLVILIGCLKFGELFAADIIFN